MTSRQNFPIHLLIRSNLRNGWSKSWPLIFFLSRYQPEVNCDVIMTSSQNITRVPNSVFIRSNLRNGWFKMLSRQSDRTQTKIDLLTLSEWDGIQDAINWDNYLTTDFGCIMQFHANLEPVPWLTNPTIIIKDSRILKACTLMNIDDLDLGNK